MPNEIHVLFPGYSVPDPEDKTAMRANCSCTLIKASNNTNIIVDTMTPWDKRKIVEGMSLCAYVVHMQTLVCRLVDFGLWNIRRISYEASCY